MNKIYIVTAYRFGDKAKHSYTVAVFDDEIKAKWCADSHTDYRGGKYSCSVEEAEVNCFDNDADYHTMEIYKSCAKNK